mmetsp:Transcript_13167/g.22156  ORF Transcript_13167/g.22156 Transcript_13167/m.22156 type:complete len:315 (-) Transcript_13167:96-1040(-)
MAHIRNMKSVNESFKRMPDWMKELEPDNVARSASSQAKTSALTARKSGQVSAPSSPSSFRRQAQDPPHSPFATPISTSLNHEEDDPTLKVPLSPSFRRQGLLSGKSGSMSLPSSPSFRRRAEPSPRQGLDPDTLEQEEREENTPPETLEEIIAFATTKRRERSYFFPETAQSSKDNSIRPPSIPFDGSVRSTSLRLALASNITTTSSPQEDLVGAHLVVATDSPFSSAKSVRFSPKGIQPLQLLDGEENEVSLVEPLVLNAVRPHLKEVPKSPLNKRTSFSSTKALDPKKLDSFITALNRSQKALDTKSTVVGL